MTISANTNQSRCVAYFGLLAVCTGCVVGLACGTDDNPNTPSEMGGMGGAVTAGASAGGHGGAGPPMCGNGIVEDDEACDDGNLTDGDSCESDCTKPGCYNNIVDQSEACFDGSVNTYPIVGANAVDMVVFDCDGDGAQDVVVLSSEYVVNVNNFYPFIRTFLNDGKGNYNGDKSTKQGYSIGKGIGLVHGEFDGNAGEDIAYISTSSLEIYPNMGNCTWAALPSVTVQLSTAPTNIVALNLDGDGRHDILLTQTPASKEYRVFLSSTGMLSSTMITGMALYSGLVAADFNGDGSDDIALTDTFYRRVVVLTWGGTTGFVKGKSYPAPPQTTGEGLLALAAGDFDHNDRIDILTVNRTANSLTHLPNYISGFAKTYDDASVLGDKDIKGRHPHAITMADIEGDGRADALVCNEGGDGDPPTVSLMINDGGGHLYVMTQYLQPLTLLDFPLEVDLIDHTRIPRKPHLVDITGNGGLDIVLLLGDDQIATMLAHP